MASIKTKETLLAELRNFLRVVLRSLDTSDNSLTKDFILTPYSVGGEAIMDQVAIARDLHLLSELSSTDLDREATNYRLERLVGSFASATLYFYTNTDPTDDIIIPANTQVSTAGTPFVSPVIFSTVSQARFPLSGVNSYYNYDRARWEFPVLAIANTLGTAGNVGLELIAKTITTVSGIDGVVNLAPSTGGRDQETDDELRQRIQLTMLGRDLNTVNGLAAFLLGLGFTAAAPVRVEDDESERGAGVDVWVINSIVTEATETFTYYPGHEYMYLANKPVTSVTSVVGAFAGTIPSTKWSANIDSSSEYRRSAYATDNVRVSASAGLLPGEQVTISYQYANLVASAQATVELNQNYVLTTDAVVKRAFPLSLTISASLTLKANADGPATRTQAKNALAQFLSTYGLGDDIQKSDLIVVLQQGFGDYPLLTVDAVIISDYYLTDELGTVYSPVNEVISVGAKQYVIYGTANIV